MPLTDLIRYFNQSDLAGESTLYAEGERIAAWHQGMRLRSLFQPIVALENQRIVGHQAFLAATLDDGSRLPAEAAYERHAEDEALVHFDRLCRTLHALNFLAQRRQTGGYLQLSIHPRHLLAVRSKHGLVFEAILRRCGLAPEDIVLELANDALTHDPRWLAALGSYRDRGYRIALTGASESNSIFVPDIIKAPLSELLAAQHPVQLHASNLQTLLDLQQAQTGKIALAQGPLFGLPQPDCLATHSSAGVAYNAHTFVRESA